MKTKKTNKVVIVGGGTAGWMAAAAISKTLGKNLEICLIESDDIGTVGVGEATIPALTSFHKLLGIKEQDFMSSTQATFKLGIEFENWGALGDRYMHPFGIVGKDCWAASFHHFWLRSIKEGNKGDLGDFSLDEMAAREGRFQIGGGSGLEHAYHFDAVRYAQFLRKFSENLGVRRIEGKVIHTQTSSETGAIESLHLMSGDRVFGDIFVDCSGFRGLLIEGALHTGYEDWSHWLPCDRAAAVQTMPVAPPVPYTKSIAHEFGWQWQIPLQHRVGNGLVYCSRYMSDEQAKELLLKSVNGEPVTEPKIIKFRTGRRLKQWNKNCIALGLASGFLEPLESTSLHLVQSGIIRLLQLFPTDGIRQEEIDEFNDQSKMELEYIRDFIILHYHATERSDSAFWNHCRTMSIPESLSKRIALFRSNGRIFREQNELFLDGSWSSVMIGQRIVPEGYHPIVDMMSHDELKQFLGGIRASNKNKVSHLMGHVEFIEKYCKAPTSTI